MKKIVFSIALCIVVLSSFGQQNPIQNLYSNLTYVTPNNCFTLSWDAPVPSVTDTLIGYKIYRNDSLYLFTTNTNISYNPCIGDTASAHFNFMVYQSSFFTHVTAIYNTSFSESVYNDSAYFPGVLATGLEECINKNGVTLYSAMPNPANDYTYINYSLPQNEKAMIMVYNSIGQLMFSESIDSSAKSHRLNTSKMAPGIYYYNISTASHSSESLRLAIVR